MFYNISIKLKAKIATTKKSQDIGNKLDKLIYYQNKSEYIVNEHIYIKKIARCILDINNISNGLNLIEIFNFLLYI